MFLLAFGDVAVADLGELAPGDDVVPFGAGVAVFILESPVGRGE